MENHHAINEIAIFNSYFDITRGYQSSPILTHGVWSEFPSIGRPFSQAPEDALRAFFGDRRDGEGGEEGDGAVEQWLRGSAQSRADLLGSKVLG